MNAVRSLLRLPRKHSATREFLRPASWLSISSPRARTPRLHTMADSEPVASQSGTPADVSNKEEKLPKLTPSEFRQYNHMAEGMDYYHNHFRHTWNTMFGACTAGKRPSGMSIRQFIAMGQQFCRQLTFHHTIEEEHIFPILAKKMPAFQEELELLTHHKKIHEGIEKMEEYLDECLGGERELRMAELKVVMEGFGEVLWEHLDAEVKQLGAENMRKFWSLDEMRRMPM